MTQGEKMSEKQISGRRTSLVRDAMIHAVRGGFNPNTKEGQTRMKRFMIAKREEKETQAAK